MLQHPAKRWSETIWVIICIHSIICPVVLWFSETPTRIVWGQNFDSVQVLNLFVDFFCWKGVDADRHLTPSWIVHRCGQRGVPPAAHWIPLVNFPGSKAQPSNFGLKSAHFSYMSIISKKSQLSIISKKSLNTKMQQTWNHWTQSHRDCSPAALRMLVPWRQSERSCG